MSNDFFRFKQFTIRQEHCAMKVSTDTCIQGAWTPVFPDVKNVLDIGSGTGLLSLMLAQRNPDIQMDAIELDEAAAMQAQQNVAHSPWKDRIRIFQGDATIYDFNKTYDLIICNPPFFINSLLGAEAGRNQARHNDSLTQEALFTIIEKNLSPHGYASVLLPPVEMRQWNSILKNKGWHSFHQLEIRPRADAKVNRIVSLSSYKTFTDLKTESLVIYEAEKKYSLDFTALLQGFYLYL